MPRYFAALWVVCSTLISANAFGQQVPAMGYMHPAGGKAGTTVEVVLGGYDWTPDMQVMTLDPRIKLELLDAPGPVIVPEPPYWFGKKARRGPFLLPRETKARLTLPAGLPAGIFEWQAANANGATKRGRFVVGDHHELAEMQEGQYPQELPKLPVAVSGRIQNIEEVDRYRFVAKGNGPITCQVVAQAIGSPLNAVIEVRNDEGQLVADAADTAGHDLLTTFVATKGTEYTIHLYDVDFRGNRAFVYRLNVTPGPGVLAAIPATGLPGTTAQVEFVGYGVKTGSAKLESVVAPVTFPKATVGETFRHTLTTPWGAGTPVELLLSETPDVVETAAGAKLNVPSAVTGTLEQRYGQDRYQLSGKKGELWSIAVKNCRSGSPLDLSVAVVNSEGKQLSAKDDAPGTIDARIDFKVPVDGDYEIVVGDSSGLSGNRAAVYRLTVATTSPAFDLSVPELVAVPSEGKAQLTVTAKRYGGFKDPIALKLSGLPTGVTVAKDAAIPAGKGNIKVELTFAAGSAVTAGIVDVKGNATIDGKPVERKAGKTLVAVTLKPPFTVDAEGKDDVTKWPRGSTFPGPVLIDRNEGFNGEIVLVMAAKQGRHRQGIRGPELVVPPNVKRILYPIFLPEWLETTRTSRMVVNGVAKIKDPKGNERYSVSRLKTRIGFLPGGALLKISTPLKERELETGKPFEIPLTISRARELTEPAQLELMQNGDLIGKFQAEPITISATATTAVLKVTPTPEMPPVGEGRITIRATVLRNGQYPVISETDVLLIFSGK